jgi:hypothetical protein
VFVENDAGPICNSSLKSLLPNDNLLLVGVDEGYGRLLF